MARTCGAGQSLTFGGAGARADYPKALEENSSTRTSDPKGEGLRLRFVETERWPVRQCYVRVSVTLARGAERFVGDAEGAAVETIELRSAATAAMNALAKATGRYGLRLIGIKRLRAFDANVIVVVLRDVGARSQRYEGAAVLRTTWVAGAVAAVLNAVNTVPCCADRRRGATPRVPRQRFVT